MDLSHLQSRLLPSSSSASSSTFPPHRTQFHPRLLSSQTRPVKPCIWIPISLLLTLPILYHVLTLLLHRPTVTTRPAKPSGFGVVIDAGPTGSRIHVFEFLNEGRIPFVGFDGKGSVSMKAGAGLREFAAEPEKAGEGLNGLIEFAKGRVPEKEWGETKVRLLENGGLVGVGMDVRRRILESCRGVLRGSGFRFRDEWASSITGQEKGIHAWVAANYVLGTLGTNPQDTTGIIELGGSSVQIIFVPKEPPPMEYSRMLKLSGITYNLYSSSIKHFGQLGNHGSNLTQQELETHTISAWKEKSLVHLLGYRATCHMVCFWWNQDSYRILLIRGIAYFLFQATFGFCLRTGSKREAKEALEKLASAKK